MLFARNADDYGTIFTYLPWLRFVFPFTIKYSNIRSGMMGVNQLLETIIDKQLQTFDPNNPRHFVDVYLREMQNHVPQRNETTFQCRYRTVFKQAKRISSCAFYHRQMTSWF